MKFVHVAGSILLLAACTPNGTPVTAAGGGGNVSQVTRINVSISAFGQVQTPAGLALGFSPEITNVTVGSGVQFVNVDNTSHTSTSIGGATTFPATSPFTFAATTPSGTALSTGWSSGTLQAGDSSAIFLVDKPGTYLFGCFFHYSGTMRGEIVAQ
jgi:plastocyanin